MLDPNIVIRNRLRLQSQKELAAELGISPGFLGDIVQGRRPPSDRVIGALGLERVVTYRRKRAANQ